MASKLVVTRRPSWTAGSDNANPGMKNLLPVNLRDLPVFNVFADQAGVDRQSRWACNRLRFHRLSLPAVPPYLRMPHTLALEGC